MLCLGMMQAGPDIQPAPPIRNMNSGTEEVSLKILMRFPRVDTIDMILPTLPEASFRYWMFGSSASCFSESTVKSHV